jgi:hypothetical protein
MATRAQQVAGDENENFHGEAYAKVAWRAEDVKQLRPRWSPRKCEEWLSNNANRIQSRTIELGWEVMRDLL